MEEVIHLEEEMFGLDNSSNGFDWEMCLRFPSTLTVSGWMGPAPIGLDVIYGWVREV